MDRISSQRRSANMRNIRSRNTAPELVLRRLLSKLGYRYRLHSRDLVGRPDVVFPGRRKAIFVHGCFWHQHSGCREGRMPASRLEYWEPKLRKNQERDVANRIQLEARGWKVLVVWECETKGIGPLTEVLRHFLEEL
jgi:DNA mismatch endonuclease (patch repair protein)